MKKIGFFAPACCGRKTRDGQEPSPTHHLPLGAGAVTPKAMCIQQSVGYPPCYLVGARASGKTTMGAVFAQALSVALSPKNLPASARPEDFQWCFLDTDDLLVRAFGESIADYVAHAGWSAFRQRESQALRAATAAATVLATGGGCIENPANGLFMREHGCVIYLSAPAAVLAERLRAQPLVEQRPTLTGAGVCAEVGTVLTVRDPLYRASAHAVLDASQDVAAVLRDMLRAYSTFLAQWARAEEDTACR
ncbi:MAG: shikimate kinase [Desulfovibrionaceae bacterium]